MGTAFRFDFTEVTNETQEQGAAVCHTLTYNYEIIILIIFNINNIWITRRLPSTNMAMPLTLEVISDNFKIVRHNLLHGVEKVQCDRSVKPNSHLHLMPLIRMRKATTSFSTREDVVRG